MSTIDSIDAPETSLQGQLIFDEINMIVAESIAAGEILRTGAHVNRLSKVYESAGFSKERITNELIIAAASAKVAVEIHNGD